MRKFYVIGISLLALFAFSAVAASSASAEGPFWIVLLLNPETLVQLKAGEEETFTGEQDAVKPVLDGAVASVECVEVLAKGKIIGNNPGMNLEELEFLKCNVVGMANCLAGNVTEENITPENVRSVLVYNDPEGSLTLAMVAFFVDNETTGSDLFVEFTLKGAECGLLNGTKVDVTADGTEVLEAGTTKVVFNKKCGVLGELGLLNETTKVFEEAANGEELSPGVVDTTKGVKEAIILNATLTSPPAAGLIECLLSAGALGAAEELAVVNVTLTSKDLFGWEN